MLPTTKCHWMKKVPYIGYKSVLIIIFFVFACVVGSLLDDAYAEVEVSYEPTETCIETHQTLNRNETQVICGRIVK